MGRLLPEHAALVALIDALPVAVFCAQTDSTPPNTANYYCNQTASDMFGLSDQSELGQQIEALEFSVDHDLVSAPNPTRPIASPLLAGLRGEYIERRDLVFKQLPLNMQSVSLDTPSGSIHAIFIQPRDHRLFRHGGQPLDTLTSEISLRDLIAFDKLISELSTKLINAQGEDAERHIQNALGALGQFCQADRTYVFLFDYDFSAMSNTHEWVRDGVTSHIDDLQNVPKEALPWFFETIEQEGLFVVHDTRAIPERGAAEQEEFDREDIRSVLCVGMYAAGELIGFVGCDMVARLRHWSEADIRRFKLVGEMIANAIQNQRFYSSLQTSQEQLIAANDALRELALRDGLTGLANRRQFTERLSEEIARSRRQGFPLTVALFDLDAFRKYNEHHGLQAGDGLLQRLAERLKTHFRRHGELVARYDGAQFAVLIPHVEFHLAQLRATSFLDVLQGMAIEHLGVQEGQVTISAGVAGLSAQSSPEELIAAAENALNMAKSKGRNQVYPSPQ